MTSFTSTTPIDRDRARLTDELRAIAQDDTRRHPPVDPPPLRRRRLAWRALLRGRTPRTH